MSRVDGSQARVAHRLTKGRVPSAPHCSGLRRDRTQKDENVISLVLHVFRNLAYLTDRHTTSTSATAVEDSQLQSDLIVAFSQEGILDLLLAMSAQADSSDYAPWNMVVLDILHLLYRGLRADELMVPEKEVEQTRLRDLLDQEAKLQDRDFGLKGSRHSRFGTTIAVQSVRSNFIFRDLGLDDPHRTR